jgi:hypothetical protein
MVFDPDWSRSGRQNFKPMGSGGRIDKANPRRINCLLRDLSEIWEELRDGGHA